MCEPLVYLSLTGTKAPLCLLSPRSRECERRSALMAILEKKRQKSLLRARRRMQRSSRLEEQQLVDFMVAMERQYRSTTEMFRRKEKPVNSLTDVSLHSRQHESKKIQSVSSLDSLNSSQVVSSECITSAKRKKMKNSQCKKSRKELDTSFVLSCGKEKKKMSSNSLVLGESSINNVVQVNGSSARAFHHPRTQLPPIVSTQELLVQSMIPLSCPKEQRSPEQDCKPRGKLKIFQSDRQSQMLKEDGIPAVPPCTPTEEHLERHRYIASLSDIRSQRQVKARLAALEEKEERAKIKADEEAKALAKKNRLQSIAALKSQQRAEIYALNKLMTDLEHKNFIEFCKAKALT